MMMNNVLKVRRLCVAESGHFKAKEDYAEKYKLFE